MAAVITLRQHPRLPRVQHAVTRLRDAAHAGVAPPAAGLSHAVRLAAASLAARVSADEEALERLHLRDPAARCLARPAELERARLRRGLPILWAGQLP